MPIFPNLVKDVVRTGPNDLWFVAQSAHALKQPFGTQFGCHLPGWATWCSSP
jgi:hypothetical protein